MELANRLERLGTETAFAVSQAASDWAAKGNEVFPFHLGDIDLPTPAPIVEAMRRGIADGHTGYCPGPGVGELREAIASVVGTARDMPVSSDQVVVQPGGKPTIGKFLQCVMNPGDEVLFPNPGFPIYESQIEYLGGVGRPYSYHATDTGFAIDIDVLESMITDRTVAFIYNDLQNPISAESTHEERAAIAELAMKHNLWVLSDEAYFDIRYSGKSSSIAALPGMAERTCILYTFSKKYAMTGWRLGASIAPVEMARWIGQLNINNESCTNHFVQYGGIAALTEAEDDSRLLLQTLRTRRDLAHQLLNEIPGVSVALPNATFYLFPDVTDAMLAKGFTDVGDFATAALHETGNSFCTRAHFGRPLPGERRKYARFAYSGIDVDRISTGLGRLKDWIES